MKQFQYLISQHRFTNEIRQFFQALNYTLLNEDHIESYVDGLIIAENIKILEEKIQIYPSVPVLFITDKELDQGLQIFWANINDLNSATIPQLIEQFMQNKKGKFIKSKRLLVTGGCGFIGSNFINHHLMQNLDDFILNIDRVDKCSNIKNINPCDRYRFVKLDINEYQTISKLLNEENISHIIHFAAQTSVDRSFETPLEFTKSNVLGTHSLLEACKNYGKIQLFLYISTDEVYGESQDDCKETDLLNPTNPYSASKAGAEFLVKSYNKSFKIPTIITRSNNVYGRFQYFDNVIPRFINQIMNGQKMTVYGKGEAKRCFLYVDDICEAFEIIIKLGKIGEIYNIGSDDELSVIQLATKLYQLMNLNEEQYISFVPDRIYNDCRYRINYDKIKLLGWNQQIKLDDGLKKTIDWYQKNINYW